VRAGSLFTGIGGIDLGLERAGLCRTVWHAETDRHCVSTLRRHWPDVPNHGDVATVDFTRVQPVDVLHGGFPCQDISEAGHGAGLEGTRSGLWSEFIRAIRDLRPRLVIVENVSALLGRGIDVVLGDLAASGFDAEWSSVRASDVGAAHTRQRIFIVAVAPHARGTGPQGTGPRVEAGRPVTPVRDPGPYEWGPYEPAVRRWGTVVGRPASSPVDPQGRMSSTFAEWHMGFPAGWTDHLSRGQAIRVLGNAVVPQVAEIVGRWAGELLISRSVGCPYCAPDENCADHGSLTSHVERKCA
jgi:DNA (cytosine-5)-methyltransferase 1